MVRPSLLQLLKDMSHSQFMAEEWRAKSVKSQVKGVLLNTQSGKEVCGDPANTL